VFNFKLYYDGLHDDNDFVPKKYVDTENAKQDIATADKTSKAYVGTGKQNIATADKTNEAFVDNTDSVLQTNIDGTKQALSELSDKVQQVDNKN